MDAETWLEALIEARREGQLLVCEVVYAEIAPAFETQEGLDAVLASLGARLDPIQSPAAISCAHWS